MVKFKISLLIMRKDTKKMAQDKMDMMVILEIQERTEEDY
jgi:hypothetical protein